MKKAIFFDVDGTLYFNKFHRLDPNILQEFDYLKEEGVDIYLLSSRSPFEIVHLPQEFLSYPYAGMILDGGAELYDHHQNLLYASPLEEDDIHKIIDYCQNNNLIWRYSGPDGNYFDSTPADSVRYHWRKLYMNCPFVKKWDGDRACNVIIWTNDVQKQKEIVKLLPEDSIVCYSDCVEIRTKGISKEDTVNRFRKEKGYRHIICVGDGMNDVGMLKTANLGVAVGNAKQAVKDAADLVIGEVSENGVSTWLATRRGR